MESVIGSVELTVQQDILIARQQARRIAELLDFDLQDQSRVAAAASEIAREVVSYAAGGVMRFLYFLEESRVPVLGLGITTRDQGTFSILLKSIDGSQSPAEEAKGFINARRLMDSFFMRKSEKDSLEAVFSKNINRVRTPAQLAELSRKIETLKPNGYLELTQLNLELLNTIELLRKRQEEIVRLNLELEETNRGVVVLYAELDEKAEQIKTADQLKTKFLSNTSHEFRTPLNSIMGLSKMLIGRQDGELSYEQDKQVRLILQSAQDLTEMVNDLLDIAKIEAGKTFVRPNPFSVTDLFGALRGMFRPLVTNQDVSIVFSDAIDLPYLYTEERKVSQILRNFISNALKFTSSGEIRVEAVLDREEMIFSVTDTGIGIAPEDLSHLFQEFSQIHNGMKVHTKGTGLGLALCKKLSELLGGSVSVQSIVGVGSTFSVRIPIAYGSASGQGVSAVDGYSSHPNTVLIIDDDEASRYLMRAWFNDTEFSVIDVGDALKGLEIARTIQPAIIILDLNMPQVDGFDFLNMLRSNPQIESTPVVVSTSKILEDSETKFLQARVADILLKSEQSPEKALKVIREAVASKV